MIGLLVHPAALCLILLLLTRGGADVYFGKVFFICLFVTLTALAATHFAGLLGLVVYLVALPYALYKYCGVTIATACVATGIFIVYQIAFDLLLSQAF